MKLILKNNFYKYRSLLPVAMNDELEKIVKNENVSRKGVIRRYYESLGTIAKEYKSSVSFRLANYLTKGEYGRLVKENALLKVFAEIDALTGLYNKRMLGPDLEKIASFCSRHGSTFSLMMLDIDNFKLFNDDYSHEVGDNILNCVGSLCLKYMRKEDKVYRFGGDEFCIILPETAKDEAGVTAERLREGINEYSMDGLPRISVSIGVASYTPGERGYDTINRADKNLNVAKRSGKNQVRLY